MPKTQHSLRVICIAAIATLLAACSSHDASDNNGITAAPFMARPDPALALPPCELPGGTIGVPDLVADPLPLPDQGNGLAANAVSDAPPDLPQQVALRNERQTYNRRYEFALRAGSIWYRSHAEVTGIVQPWAALTMPACLIGTVIGISADDDELIALRANGAVYGMDNVLKDRALFNWSTRWGPPVWTGSGRSVPADFLAWTWSVISPAEDKNWIDPAGNATAVGQGKVSHIWLLREGGQRYTYIDPWLPKDEAYEMCGPQRGRVIAQNLAASGSTIASIDSGGNIYTRNYDFDLGGNDALFFNYSYDDQRGVSNPAIQLPTFDWVLQPRVPGRITASISLHKLGENMQHRVLRVEGIDAAAHTGYWERDVADAAHPPWLFTITGAPLRGELLTAGASPLGQAEDLYYRHARGSGDDDWSGELLDFNVYCSPARLRIQVASDPPFELRLHTTDKIRQTPRARGLDDNPRAFSGALEIPSPLLETLAQQPAATQAFIQQHLKGQRFTMVGVTGITGEISVDELSWVFSAR